MGQELEIVFRGEECSDFLNFVVKDASTDVWYDFYGDNFHVPLRLALSSLALDEASMDGDSAIPDDQLPELPAELTGVWAYIKWEHDGCPNRSQADSDAEYQRGILVCATCASSATAKAPQMEHPGVHRNGIIVSTLCKALASDCASEGLSKGEVQ